MYNKIETIQNVSLLSKQREVKSYEGNGKKIALIVGRKTFEKGGMVT